MREAAEAPPPGKVLPLVNVSEGLPTEGLWRQDIVLSDMNGDGFLDIIAPPVRKAKPGQARPSVFIYDPKAGRWSEGDYTFPAFKGYDYGGVAAGDLNNDGLTDIVLATHTGDIVILLNDGRGGFSLSTLPMAVEFHSRAVTLADVNGDGWLDIVALSEAPFSANYKPKGIVVALNDQGKGWKVKIQEGGQNVFGDTLAAADLTGSGRVDLAIAPLTFQENEKKILWFNDGTGSFRPYLPEATFFGDRAPLMTRAGDVDGDGRAEAVFSLSGRGVGSTVALAAYKWNGTAMVEISAGLEGTGEPLAFDLCDVDGDGKQELILLSSKGVSVHKYGEGRWSTVGYYQVPKKDLRDVHSLRAGVQRDGSVLIVYNLGPEDPAFNRGIRAMVLK